MIQRHERDSQGRAPAHRGLPRAAGYAPPAEKARTRARKAASRKLETLLGGSERVQVVAVLAAVLALSSADSSTVGASATELRHALHIGNADIGLLVSVSAAVGAIASLPFGVLVDRVHRIRLLTITVTLWGGAMIASAAVSTFGALLFVRLFLGFVTAVAGPAVASLVGDYFPGDERGKIYGYILTGELLGAGVGFFITGDVAVVSWRAAFVILALPAFALAWQIRKLKEPERGASNRAQSSDAAKSATAVQVAAQRQGLQPDPELVLREDPRQMNIIAVARYVMRVRTNVILILSGVSAYFFMTGVQTFGLEFVGQQYRVHTVVANLLMLVIGAAAVFGVLAGGTAGDALVKSGRINGRMLVAGIAATATALLFIPPLFTHSPLSALPYIAAAAFCLTAQNPTLDAARLDIMPPLLWGRAEGIRTLLRSAAQSLAPVTFGGLADLFQFTGQGLRITFFIMLLPLLASGVILLRGLKYYPTDVATAAAAAPPGAPPPRPRPRFRGNAFWKSFWIRELSRNRITSAPVCRISGDPVGPRGQRFRASRVRIGRGAPRGRGAARAHQISRVLQESLLPSALPAGGWFDLTARYVPGVADLRVRGDWYDAQIMSDGTVALSVGDVAGHGVGARPRWGRCAAP